MRLQKQPRPIGACCRVVHCALSGTSQHCSRLSPTCDRDHGDNIKSLTHFKCNCGI